MFMLMSYHVEVILVECTLLSYFLFFFFAIHCLSFFFVHRNVRNIRPVYSFCFITLFLNQYLLCLFKLLPCFSRLFFFAVLFVCVSFFVSLLLLLLWGEPFFVILLLYVLLYYFYISIWVFMFSHTFFVHF